MAEIDTLWRMDDVELLRTLNKSGKANGRDFLVTKAVIDTKNSEATAEVMRALVDATAGSSAHAENLVSATNDLVLATNAQGECAARLATATEGQDKYAERLATATEGLRFATWGLFAFAAAQVALLVYSVFFNTGG